MRRRRRKEKRKEVKRSGEKGREKGIHTYEEAEWNGPGNEERRGGRDVITGALN